MKEQMTGPFTFEHFLLANNVKEDTQKQHLLLAMLGGHTFKLLASLIAPRKPGRVDYTEILKSIGTAFETQADKNC